MIRPRPGSDPWKALEAIVGAPDELGPDEVAALLWPLPPVPPAVPIGPEGYRVWAANRRRLWEQREEEGRRRRAKAARLLGRLQEAGLLHPREAPRLAVWWPARVAERGEEAALRGLLSPESSSLLDVPDPDRLPAAVVARALELCRAVGKSPATAEEARGGRDGTTTRAWRALVRAGIVVAGGVRRATVEGIALVGGR